MYLDHSKQKSKSFNRGRKLLVNPLTFSTGQCLGNLYRELDVMINCKHKQTGGCFVKFVSLHVKLKM